MKIEKTNAFNTIVTLRPSPGKVFKVTGVEIYFTHGMIGSQATTADISRVLEEVPAASVPRTPTELEEKVATAQLAVKAAGITAPEGVAKWKSDMLLVADQQVEHLGQTYDVIQPHRTQTNWPPPATPALFKRAACRAVSQPPRPARHMTAGKQTSDKVSALAAKILSGSKKPTPAEIKTLAASALSQDEKKGKRGSK